MESDFRAESKTEAPASLFPTETSPHEKKLLRVLKQDESTHIDEIVELLDGVLSPSEIFAVLFELELNGKIKQMPGKNFVKSM
jgi:DNA processing protein